MDLVKLNKEYVRFPCAGNYMKFSVIFFILLSVMSGCLGIAGDSPAGQAVIKYF